VGTEEGDPVDLAIRRTGTFENRQIAMVSTPTIADVSRIEEVYHESDQRKYYVPCPHYGILQVLRWAQVKWPERTPAEAWYEFYAIGFPLLSLVIELDVSDWDRPVAKIVSQDIS